MTESEEQHPSAPTRYGKLLHPGRRSGDRVDEAQVLSGGGDAGAVMRARDWSRTSLGPVTEWSEALRAIVGVLLRNRFPLMLFWGPELVQLYNDAYRPITGAKHPLAMGQPARECWPEIWPTIGPLLESALRGQPATANDDLLLLIDRNDFLEETHFKLAFSPVPDDTIEATGIGGVLATVAETTEQVYRERQLKTLRELGARTAEATTPEQACEMAAATFAENAFDVPFALFYLAQPDSQEVALAASCGFEANAAAASSGWPVRRVLATRSIESLHGLRESHGALPSGPWSEPPRCALALPLSALGAADPYGVLIVGCNPHRALDDGYRGFFELASAQTATAIRNADASEEHSQRADALEREEYVAELQQTVRLAETFISVVGHDLRNPLSAISAAGALLSRRNESDAAMKLISLILKGSEEMSSMLDQLVDFARIRLGHDFELARADVDLAEICELVSAAAGAAHRCSVSLEQSGDVVGHWDEKRLRQLVTTLTDNGCRHRTQDSVVVLRLDGSRTDSVRLEVWNEGVIAPDRLAVVFKPAAQRPERARSSRDAGLGLGLYLGQQIVMAHGGSIRVESSQEHGTRFVVELPRVESGSPAANVR